MRTGNHELWRPRHATERTRGEERYAELVAICRDFGVISPEDAYPAWPDEPDTLVVGGSTVTQRGGTLKVAFAKSPLWPDAITG